MDSSGKLKMRRLGIEKALTITLEANPARFKELLKRNISEGLQKWSLIPGRKKAPDYLCIMSGFMDNDYFEVKPFGGGMSKRNGREAIRFKGKISESGNTVTLHVIESISPNYLVFIGPIIMVIFLFSKGSPLSILGLMAVYAILVLLSSAFYYISGIMNIADFRHQFNKEVSYLARLSLKE